jgi:hypothetical protein
MLHEFWYSVFLPQFTELNEASDRIRFRPHCLFFHHTPTVRIPSVRLRLLARAMAGHAGQQAKRTGTGTYHYHANMPFPAGVPRTCPPARECFDRCRADSPPAAARMQLPRPGSLVATHVAVARTVGVFLVQACSNTWCWWQESHRSLPAHTQS